MRSRLQQIIDLNDLTTRLLAVVEETMQPASNAVWLRPLAKAATQPRYGYIAGLAEGIIEAGFDRST